MTSLHKFILFIYIVFISFIKNLMGRQLKMNTNFISYCRELCEAQRNEGV